jgi:hypothetical protein
MFLKQKEKLNMDSLRKVFDDQKAILIGKDYPVIMNISLEDFNKSFEVLWQLFIDKANGLEIKSGGNIPLLIIPTNGNQEERIKIINGHTELDFKKIKNDNEGKENNFYILLDVEDGTKMVAKSAKDCLKKFNKESRFALNLDESIALLTYYPELLKNHYLITAGSSYNKDDENQPLLWLLDEDHNPELHYAWFDIAHGSYGTGSYKIKIK